MKFISLDGKKIYPTKIVCVGRNYVAHIAELNNEVPSEPVLFIKPNSAITDELFSHATDVIHFEGEISFLVQAGKLDAVGFGLDLTKRAMQSELKAKGLPWERAKSFDRAAVFSEFVSYKGNISDLRMELYINDVLTQQANYDLMLHKPDAILSEIATFLTLEDGDLIMTGTPKGVGPLKVGDRFHGRIFAGERAIVEASWVVK